MVLSSKIEVKGSKLKLESLFLPIYHKYSHASASKTSKPPSPRPILLSFVLLFYSVWESLVVAMDKILFFPALYHPRRTDPFYSPMFLSSSSPSSMYVFYSRRRRSILGIFAEMVLGLDGIIFRGPTVPIEKGKYTIEIKRWGVSDLSVPPQEIVKRWHGLNHYIP